MLPLHLDQSHPVNSLSFDSTGSICAWAVDDSSVHIFDVTTGSVVKTCHVRKYGAANLCCTHHPTSLLYSATTEANKGLILYHSLHDNKYLRYFNAHTDR